MITRIFKHLLPQKPIYYNVSISDGNYRLIGKRVIITGGSSGIGKAIAKKAIAEGAKVVITGRNEDRLKLVASDLGKDCSYIPMDVQQMSLATIEKAEIILKGKITNIVNNAGVYVQHEGRYSKEEFEETLKINTISPFFITQEYIQYCVSNNINGNVLMTSSNRGLFGDVSPYGISKAALNNFVQGAAREHINHHIRINAICPGMTATEINHIDANGNVRCNARGGRILLPEEIAEVAAFLMSDFSDCINGAIIPCDEGDYLR